MSKLASPLSLEELLSEWSEADLLAFGARVGITPDPLKRLGAREQIGRALASRGQLARFSGFDEAERALLLLLAEHRGRLHLGTLVPLPPAATGLVEKGWAFVREHGAARDHGAARELILPSAHLLMLPNWESEDPRSARALLSRMNWEAASHLVRFHRPKLVGAPQALALETPFAVLLDPKRLRALVRELPPTERALLERIVQLGGEVETPELLELERQPSWIQYAGGVSSHRRGQGFELERRGLLFSTPPNRHVVPLEVMSLVGEREQRILVLKRAKSRRALEQEASEPLRASYASDPTPLVLAFAFEVRRRATLRAGVGTPKSLLQSLATRFGVERERVALLAALSRKLGLWEDPPATFEALELAALGPLLLRSLRHDGVWDEGRLEPEVPRARHAARGMSPAHSLREALLEALLDLGAGAWVPGALLCEYALADARVRGFERQLSRWGRRTGVAVGRPNEIVRHMLFRTLPWLGMVDVGEQTSDTGAPDGSVRLSRWGRIWLGRSSAPEALPSRFVDAERLQVGPEARVSTLLDLGALTAVGRTTGSLELVLDYGALDDALANGAEPRELSARFAAVAAPSEQLLQWLEARSRLSGRAQFVAAGGFVWIDDPALLKDLVQGRASASWVLPSPPGGLLVAPGVTFETLARRCRAAGVELWMDAETRLTARRK